jgi:hypothetical protein
MKRVVLLWAGCISAVLLLAACSAPSEPTHRQTVTVDGTTFSGPWAQEFAQRFESSSSALVKKIFQDGMITEAEFTEVTLSYRDCLAADGITFNRQGEDGSTDFTFPREISADEANRTVDLCSRRSEIDSVGGLYRAMDHNPRSLD